MIFFHNVSVGNISKPKVISIFHGNGVKKYRYRNSTKNCGKKEKIMIVKDLIALAARFGEREDIAKYLYGSIVDEESEGEVEKLLDAYRIIEQDIAMRVGHLRRKERFETEDGVIHLDELSLPPVRIKRVENELGVGLPYLLFPSRIETSAGVVFLEYTALPRIKGLNDQAELPLGVMEETIACGVAAEYDLMNGLYEEASILDKRYKSGIVGVCLKSPKERMGARKWA